MNIKYEITIHKVFANHRGMNGLYVYKPEVYRTEQLDLDITIKTRMKIETDWYDETDRDKVLKTVLDAIEQDRRHQERRNKWPDTPNKSE